MTGVAVIIAASVVSIDVGWQPLPGGGFEYIIQIEPEMLETMKAGQDISSQLPPALRGVRNYRIKVGSGPLPHEGEPPPAEVPLVTPPQQNSAPHATIRAEDVATDPTAAGANDHLPGPELEGQLPPPPADPTLTSDGRSTVTPGEPSPPSRDLAATDPSATTPPPALGPDEQPPEFIPRTAGYQLSTAAAEAAGKGDAQRDSGKMTFPGAGLSRLTETPAGASTKENEATDAKAGGAGGAGTASSTSGAAGATSETEAKPWLPLVGSVLALFGSLGTNLYLGWNTLTLRSRYRALLAQHGAG